MSIAAEPLWGTSPEFIEARRDEVHVWRAGLDVTSLRVESLSLILSADERQRAGRFRFERDRRRFIVTRALLRILIGRYLRKKPSEIEFTYGPNGKPFLSGGEGAGLRFNLSHSGELALYAVTCGREIGVDVEYSSESVDTETLAERFFSPREVAALKSLPDHEKHRAFFTCWTRKEAYVKARGEGLSIPLDAFSVSLRPEDPPSLKVQSDPEESSRWSLLAIDPDPDYVGAVAVEGRAPVLRCWHFPGNLQTQSLSVAAIQPVLF